MSRSYSRRHLRLRGRDYSKAGAYFVTICTINQADLFGTVVGAQVRLTDIGRVVADTWDWLPSRYAHVRLDEWCVMPNHLHGILVLTTRVARAETDGCPERASGPVKSLGRLVGAFKTKSTNHANRLRGTPGAVLWQRDFWDRVIRNDDELSRVREYIRRNPAQYAPRTFTM